MLANDQSVEWRGVRVVTRGKADVISDYDIDLIAIQL